MYIKIRKIGAKLGEEDLILNISKKAKIQELRQMIFDELNVEKDCQRLLYKGKVLNDDNELYEYNVQLNDVIQLMIVKPTVESTEDKKADEAKPTTSTDFTDMVSLYYKVDDKVDIKDINGAWFEGKIERIYKNEATDKSEPPSNEPDLLFKCLQESEYIPTEMHVNFDQIRPRSYYTYKPLELAEDLTVLTNYNIDEPKKRGYWYDFKISSTFLKSLIKGTLFMGISRLPLEDITLAFPHECLRIESPKLLTEREDVDLYSNLPLRKVPYNCLKCKDNPKVSCKACGCRVCYGKNNVENILLCDECDDGYHIGCLTPPLEEVPSEDDWYCPECKTDENEIVKAGEKLKVSNKKSKMPSAKEGSSRDWGRGMACVGRTKVCTIVSTDHLGAVPGVEVGTCWKYRLQVSEAGIHRPLVAGIHGRESGFAYSIVLSGGYEDDIDNGDEFYYTGSGGRDLSGNKRVSAQSCDQTLTRMNKALAMNCNAKFNVKDGAEAANWQGGKPVRVVRNFKAAKHSKYAPKSGNRYDGVYKVVKYYPEKGKSGFIVWRYLLRRDDPSPAPWHSKGKEFDMILPEGFLEAQKKKEEAKAAGKKGTKRVLKDSSNETVAKKPKTELYVIPEEIRDEIKRDEKNAKLWEECVAVVGEGKAKFLSKLEEVFICICCQELVYKPVTTECKHNICSSCLKRSFTAKIYNCPYCRFDFGDNYKITVNEVLGKILLGLFPGYNNGR